MPRNEQVTVSSTTASAVTGPDGAAITVQNLGPDSCYYATAATVSSGSNDGTLTSGSSLSFFPSKFFISAGTSKLQVAIPLAGEQFRQYDKDNKQAGQYACGPWFTVVAQVLTASRGYAQRFVLSRPMTVTSLAFDVNTVAGTDDAVDVGLYNSGLGKIVSTGATLGQLTTLGIRPQTITPTVLQANTVYYAALSVGTFGGTAVQLRGINYLTAGSVGFFGASAPQVEAIQFTSSAHPLPTTITPAAAPTAVPLIALRES